jgi:hypothetical protein
MPLRLLTVLTKQLSCGTPDRVDLFDASGRPLELLLGLRVDFTMSIEKSHTISLPQFPPPGVSYQPAPVNAEHIAHEWATRWENILILSDISALETVFRQDCWWRDMLALSWDFRTIRGFSNVCEYVKQNLATSQLKKIRLRETGEFQPALRQPTPGVRWIESMFDFETKLGRGSGVVRLVQSENAQWKAYMVYTVLHELKGFEERTHLNRPHGGNNALMNGATKGNWQEQRQREKDFVDSEPAVVVIGAGEQYSSFFSFACVPL